MSDPSTQPKPVPIPVEEIESAVIRFAGDSGDGIQLTGMQFTTTTAFAGNDLSTFPDYPAEIRAPVGTTAGASGFPIQVPGRAAPADSPAEPRAPGGTTAGVSGFQIQFASRQVLTPGDAPDVFVAMNPAALK